MARRLQCVVLFATCALTFDAAPLSPPSDSADAVPPLHGLAQRIVSAGAPGAIVAVRDTHGTLAAAAGHADLAAKRKMRPSDRFRIGSVTKTFLATVVLQLVGERRLALDDPIERWLPRLVPNGGATTIRQLLSHTSGIYPYTDDEQLVARLRSGSPGRWTPRELVALATAHKPLFAPGSTWAYSNTNYVLIGMIVEAATGRSINEEVRRRIVAPLDLRSTDLRATGALPKPHAHGYLPRGEDVFAADGGPRDVTNLGGSWAWPAGAMTSTVDDLGRFYAALLGGGLLHRDLLAAMTDTVESGDGNGGRYGLGLASAPSECGAVWGHVGVFPGYTVVVLSSRNGRRQAIALANASFDGSAGAGVKPTVTRAASAAYCAAS